MKSLDILNCGEPGEVVFTFQCPMRWEQMTPTEHTRQRHCDRCARRVTLCVDANEAALRAEQGECIAVPTWLVEGAREDEASRAGRLMVGQARGKLEIFAEIVEAKEREG